MSALARAGGGDDDVTVPDVYRATPGLSSLISVPQRCALWGDASFRGNCDGTLFKELVLRYRPNRIADPMLGSGTTADVVAGLRTHGVHDAQFWGSDLSRGFDLRRDALPGMFDFVWLHPPYWNIIRYGNGDARDLSRIDDYGEFVMALQACLQRCCAALAPGGRLAVLVADIRRCGRYYCLGADVMQMQTQLGCKVASVIIKAQHNCRSDNVAYARMPEPPIKHEYCVVFRKEM